MSKEIEDTILDSYYNNSDYKCKEILDNYKNMEKNKFNLYIIGLIHYINLEFEKAYNFFHKSMSLGYSKAFLMIGIFYEFGFFVKQNIDYAIYYFEKSISDNNVDNILYVAEFFFEHNNLKKASDLCKKIMDISDDCKFLLAIIDNNHDLLSDLINKGYFKAIHHYANLLIKNKDIDKLIEIYEIGIRFNDYKSAISLVELYRNKKMFNDLIRIYDHLIFYHKYKFDDVVYLYSNVNEDCKKKILIMLYKYKQNGNNDADNSLKYLLRDKYKKFINMCLFLSKI